MRKLFPLLPLLLAGTACGRSDNMERQPQAAVKTYNVEEPPPAPAPAMPDQIAPTPPPPLARMADAPSPPDISPRAAPGVAFNYRYAFRLPAGRIAGVQEEHAQACEKLGVARCRITGMLYRVVSDQAIEARLALKLDPALARDFGKSGIAAVTRAAGKLVESEISGEDVGSRIKAATRSEGDLREELARIERQLAGGARPAERAELQAQAEQLRDSLRALKAGRDDDREALASTPLVFTYSAGEAAPAREVGSPIGQALGRAWDNVLGGVAVMLIVLISLLPWAVMLGLAVLAFRAAARRFKWGETVEVS